MLLQSVGDSSVSSSSDSATSARGISPSRSDDSRSISPIPVVHKTTHRLNQTVLSNCSSSSIGNQSSVQGKNSTLKMSAPVPKPKKRAAPLPPGMNTTLEESRNSVNNNHSMENASSIVSPVKPMPRKKEAPKEPPKIQPVGHQTINHSRQSSDSSGYHESSVLSDHHHDSHHQRLERYVVDHPPFLIDRFCSGPFFFWVAILVHG